MVDYIRIKMILTQFQAIIAIAEMRAAPPRKRDLADSSSGSSSLAHKKKDGSPKESRTSLASPSVQSWQVEYSVASPESVHETHEVAVVWQ